MEKYGVEENERKKKKTKGESKEASAEEEKCPACDAEVETHGKTRKCPVHGTEPYEEKEGGEENSG